MTASNRIVNPITREQTTFLKTGDALLRFEDRVAPHGWHVPVHTHCALNECWEVLAGKLGVRVGTQKRVLGPGARVEIPRGTMHTWWNADDAEDVRFLVELRPGGTFETFQRGFAEMAWQNGGQGWRMLRHPLRLLELIALGDNCLPIVPLWAQRPLVGALTAVARRRQAARDRA